MIRLIALPIALSILITQASLASSEPNQLVIYTYDSFVSEWGPGPKIKTTFEKQCGNCEIKFVALDSSAGLLNRVKLEGKSSKADIILGLDTSLMADAETSGLLADSLTNLSALNLPVSWTSDVFVPYDYGFFAFVYDTEKLSNPPSSLKALVDAPDSLKIIVQDPRTSTPGLGLLLWVKKVYGDQAHIAWAKLRKKIVTVTKGWSEAYFSLFLNGEAPMVLSYSTSPAYHIAIDKTERYQAAQFSDGHYLQVEVAAMLRSSKKPKLARKFLQFILTPEFQSELPLTNVMYPAIDIGEKLPDVFSQLISIDPVLTFSSEEVRTNRKKWMNEWLNTMSH